MQQPPEKILRIEGLVKTFKSNKVLDGIDLTVAPRETVCVLGPSGSGKSTVLRCINWLETPDAGFIYLKDQRVGVQEDGKKPMSDKELSKIRARMGMVFQSFAFERAAKCDGGTCECAGATESLCPRGGHRHAGKGWPGGKT
jgi:ABC-type polar amino acid transport system ATPase subunit